MDSFHYIHSSLLSGGRSLKIPRIGDLVLLDGDVSIIVKTELAANDYVVHLSRGPIVPYSHVTPRFDGNEGTVAQARSIFFPQSFDAKPPQEVEVK